MRCTKLRCTSRSVAVDAVAQVTPRCSARSDNEAPGLRWRNASDRNCGMDRDAALFSRISARINRITNDLSST